MTKRAKNAGDKLHMCVYSSQADGFGTGYLRIVDGNYLEPQSHCKMDEVWDFIYNGDGTYCIKWAGGDRYLSNWEDKLAIAPWCQGGEHWVLNFPPENHHLGVDSTIRVPGKNLYLRYREFSTWWNVWNGLDLSNKETEWTMSPAGTNSNDGWSTEGTNVNH